MLLFCLSWHLSQPALMQFAGSSSLSHNGLITVQQIRSVGTRVLLSAVGVATGLDAI